MNKLLYFLSIVPCLLFLECTPDYSFLEGKGFYCEKEEDCEKGWVCNKVKKICEKKEDVFEDVKVVEEEIFDFLKEEEKIEIDIKEEDVFEERVEVVEDFYEVMEEVFEVMEEVEVKIPKLLCSPCIIDEDCNEKGFELKCIEFDVYGRFCLTKCPCFEGYKCKDDYCYPENGICKCTKEFEGKKTKCYKKNEYGKCFGDIKCENEKFTLCGAPEPQKEICDDIDNNCDGNIDEDFLDKGSSCALENPCVKGIFACGGDGSELECKTTPVEGSCEDGLFCTEEDKCENGQCKGGTKKDCSFLNDDCNKGICNEDKKECLKEPVDNETPCPLPNANAECKDGICNFISCKENYYDLNKDEIGCEYFCEKTNNGIEICDGKDNDCNGMIDEGKICGCGEECMDGKCSFTACKGKECGDDGCGGSCGTCKNGYKCENDKCVLIVKLLPDTGQDKCYNDTSEITCPSSAEDFFGQDALYTINPMDFTDNGDGTITDNITGLIWMKCSAGQSGSDCSLENAEAKIWNSAIDYCNDLIFANYDNWRLPNRFELQTIVNYGKYNPAIDINYFPNTQNKEYWSSSTYASDSALKWIVNFESGYLSPSYFQTPFYVRCVREGNLKIHKFVDNDNGTITDTGTGLMWQKAGAEGTYKWKDALKYCEDLNTGEFFDWRLPDIKELSSLINDTKYDPAIDKDFFPDTKSVDYWSSSTPDKYPTNAWTVRFNNGQVLTDNKALSRYVRCVR